MVAIEVKATCETMADQPEKGGCCRRKKRKTRPKKPSMELRQAQCFFGPGGRQAGAVLLSGAGSRARQQQLTIGGVDPVDQLESSLASI